MSKEHIDKLYSGFVADGSYEGKYEDFVSAMETPEYRDKVFQGITESGEFEQSRDAFDIYYRPEAKGHLGAQYDNKDLVDATEDNPLFSALGGKKTDKTKLKQVDWQMMGLQEEEVVENLERMYGTDIFEFGEAILGGDYVNITHKESGEKIRLSVDNFTDTAKKKNATELNDFISKYVGDEPTRERVNQSHGVSDEYTTLKTLITTDLSEDVKLKVKAEAEQSINNSFNIPGTDEITHINQA